MLNFQWIVSKLKDQVTKKIYCVKGQLSKTYFREMGIFFSDLVMQYFVEIFSEPLKRLFTNKFRNCLIFTKCPKNNRPSVYLKKRLMGLKDILVGQVLWNWWFFSSSDFVTFFCIYRVFFLFNWPLCRLNQHKKSQNQQFILIFKWIIILF